MSSLPVPPTTVNVLEGLPNQFTLPWRRFFQSQAPAASGGGGGTPGPAGPRGPAGPTGPAGPPGPSEPATFTPFDLLQIGKSGSGGVTSVSSANGDLTVTLPTTTPVLTVNSAPKLDTARTFTYTGDATGGPTSFDGSANVSTALTLANSGVVAGTYGDGTHVGQFTVNGKGIVTSASSVVITGAAVNTNWFPLVSGTEPPNWITDGAGNPIAIAFTGT